VQRGWWLHFDKHCDSRLFFNKLTSWLTKWALSRGGGGLLLQRVHILMFVLERKMLSAWCTSRFETCFSVSTCYFPSRLHVRIMHCFLTISSPGMRKVTNVFVHKLAGFKNNVHSHTPKEYCFKPTHQLCKLRFVLMMQAELPVKWNAFQTQKHKCACSSFDYEGRAPVLINLKNRNTSTNFWHDRCVTPRTSECTTQVRTEEKPTWKFANICFYGAGSFVSKQNKSVKVYFSVFSTPCKCSYLPRWFFADLVLDVTALDIRSLLLI